MKASITNRNRDNIENKCSKRNRQIRSKAADLHTIHALSANRMFILNFITRRMMICTVRKVESLLMYTPIGM